MIGVVLKSRATVKHQRLVTEGPMPIRGRSLEAITCV
jgi:hypothetical protein